MNAQAPKSINDFYVSISEDGDALIVIDHIEGALQENVPITLSFDNGIIKLSQGGKNIFVAKEALNEEWKGRIYIAPNIMVMETEDGEDENYILHEGVVIER